MEFGIPEKSLQLIKKTIAQFPQIKQAAIFGSRALGNYRHGSDIDISIAGEEIDYQIVSKLSRILNEDLPLPYYFDIIDYTHLTHQNLKQHIHDYGKTLY